jgi:hypothetical protein
VTLAVSRPAGSEFQIEQLCSAPNSASEIATRPLPCRSDSIRPRWYRGRVSDRREASECEIARFAKAVSR